MKEVQNISTSGFQRSWTFYEQDNKPDISRLNFKTIEITPSKPGLHESAEDIAHRPVYHISHYKKPSRVLGMKIPGSGEKRTRKYIKLLPLRSRIPEEARHVYDLSSHIQGFNEMAIYLSTHFGNSKVNALLAIRVENRWYEVYQWKTTWNKLKIFRSNL